MSKVRVLKDFIKRFYLEMVAIVFFIAASIILGFYVAFWDFILAEAIIIVYHFQVERGNDKLAETHQKQYYPR